MNNYLAITPKYLSAHKKNTKLTILSVIISVALVTTIFSMMDIFWQFEKQQIINDYGSYHIIVKYVTDEQTAIISSRIDVDAASRYIEVDGAKMNGTPVEIATADESIEKMFRSDFSIIKGFLPKENDEIVVEQWAMESYKLNINDTVQITSGSGSEKEFRICGICKDFSVTKAEGIPGLLVSAGGAYSIKPDAESCLIVQFKDHVNINNAEKEIMQTLSITDDRIGHNERLLAMMGQSMNSTVSGLYGTGAVLFILVLVAGVTMIYNTFNISVMDRIRQFGLLRCIGASRKQIEKLVRREGSYIALKALPIGVITGILVTFTCSAVLKFYNSSFFAGIPLFRISVIGILAGIAIGMLTVFIATLAPAKKAAQVSPVSAVAGSAGIQVAKKEKRGFLTGIFHVENAIGISNALSKKKTLFLMSASIAISIILFLGFQVFINFMYSSMKTNKPYTADISLVSESGLDYSLYSKLSSLDGVKRVYGRMFGYVDATFDASRLTEAYKQEAGNIEIHADGLFTAPEKSWLISYDINQLKWAKTDLIRGTLSEDKLNDQNGIIAVVLNTRKGVSMETASLKLGDKVFIKTVSGTKEFTVMAILRTVPFADSNLNLTTFITTEKQFTGITGDSRLKIIGIQLKGTNQQQTVSKIKNMIGEDVKFLDARQRNEETTQAFLTAALFVYGFVIVIALISILNIINTMQTSVSSKIRYLGVMRAVGMSGKQLDRMVIVEAGTYSISGSIAGIILGIMLQKILVTKLLAGAHMNWKFPSKQIIIIFAITLLVTLVSTMGPLKKIKSRGISETIGSIQ